jgi:hypothetical protein
VVSTKLQTRKGKPVPKTATATALIAKWMIDQDASIDPPRVVRWADGSPATHIDYLTHMVDTHTCISGINGIELHMFPDVMADVRYDDFARTWVISGVGVTPAALDLTDPNAPDEQIIAELYTYPIVYRARIHR